MKLTCKHCGYEIPAADVNIAALMAKCNACNAVFGFAPEGGAAARQRAPVAMPDKMQVEQRGNELVITHKWMTAAAYFLVFFCLIWDGFMIAWFSIAIAKGVWIMAAFGTLHAAVGVGLTYFTICLFVNKTTIRVTRSELSVVHGPLRWPGNLSLKSTMIAQIWSQEKITHGKNGATITYEVHANSTHGKSKKLVSGFSNSGDALFIEQEIERFLGIADAPVPGELRR